MIKIGVVCEGPCDFIIIEWCLGAALKGRGYDIEFVPFQPARDRTSGTYNDGGWHQVYKWCVRNDAEARQRFFNGGLFADADAMAVDLIVVHCDGDLRKILADRGGWEDLAFDNPDNWSDTPEQALDYCSKLLAGWLYGHVNGNVHPREDNTICAPIVFAGEAWLLAALGLHANPEEIKDVKAEFSKLWLAKSGRNVPEAIKQLKRHVAEITYATKTGSPLVDDLLRIAPAFQSALTSTLSLLPDPA